LVKITKFYQSVSIIFLPASPVDYFKYQKHNFKFNVTTVAECLMNKHVIKFCLILM